MLVGNGSVNVIVGVALPGFAILCFGCCVFVYYILITCVCCFVCVFIVVGVFACLCVRCF